jgi:DNA-binding response OmpR family regulator
MAKRRILIVDDNEKIVDVLRAYLEKDGYRALTALDGLEALEVARRRMPDLIILDLLLPGMDGLDVCRVLRAEGNDVPIIMLTAKTTEPDKLIGLELGADDYVTKPFSPREVMARVRAVLRRAGEGGDQVPSEMERGNLVLDLARHQVRLNGTPTHLTPTEFSLLEVLAKEPGRAFSRLELLERAFGHDFEGLERTVDVHIMNLRKKIEPDAARPIYILTVYGVGYKFAGERDAA